MSGSLPSTGIARWPYEDRLAGHYESGKAVSRVDSGSDA